MAASVTDYDPVVLAPASELHTGAEIEAAFIEALHRAFAEDREPGKLDLGEVLNESVPLCRVHERIHRAPEALAKAERGMLRPVRSGRGDRGGRSTLGDGRT